MPEKVLGGKSDQRDTDTLPTEYQTVDKSVGQEPLSSSSSPQAVVYDTDNPNWLDAKHHFSSFPLASLSFKLLYRLTDTRTDTEIPR